MDIAIKVVINKNNSYVTEGSSYVATDMLLSTSCLTDPKSIFFFGGGGGGGT